MSTGLHIRTANIDTDLPVIVRLINPYETSPVSVDQMRERFLYNPPGRIHLRLVVVDEHDAVIGYSVINHEISDPAGHFHVWMVVEPAWRRQGAGSGLWNASIQFLREQGATHLAAEANEDDPASLTFATQRGFSIDRHAFHSTLDLTAFDETPYLSGIAALEARGIRFCSLADFPDTPETRRKLYDLNMTNVLDIPGVSSGPWSFAEFEKFIIEAPWFNRKGQLLAVDGEVWVGLAAVSLNAENHSAYNEHTGVLRAYRGQKICQALKVAAARFARESGARTLGTHNDSFNAPILAINRKMGYQPQPGKYLLVCSLGTDGGLLA